jgi:hypothetical protein
MAMSKTFERCVSSPDAATMRCFAAGAGSDSSAAASPRPSAMPPAATTGTSRPEAATRSTTAGTSGNVARLAPWPPASLPCATMDVSPLRQHLPRLRDPLHLAYRRNAGRVDAWQERPGIAERQHTSQHGDAGVGGAKVFERMHGSRALALLRFAVVGLALALLVAPLQSRARPSLVGNIGPGPPIGLRLTVLQRPGDDADAANMLVVYRHRPGQFGGAIRNFSAATCSNTRWRKGSRT